MPVEAWRQYFQIHKHSYEYPYDDIWYEIIWAEGTEKAGHTAYDKSFRNTRLAAKAARRLYKRMFGDLENALKINSESI